LECILNTIDPRFDVTQGLNYRLSVLLCQDGFSFLITDAVSNRILKLASYQLAHSDLQHGEISGWPVKGTDYFEYLKKSDLGQFSFQRVDIAVASHKVTVAPSEFIQADHDAEIMALSHSRNADEIILNESILDPGPVTAILIPRYIKENCERIFPGSRLHCAPAIVVKGIIREYAQLPERQVFINLYRRYFEITVIQGSRLLYFNAFKFSAPSDVIYYVIFVLEQLGFVPSEEKVTLMGDINENTTIPDQLKMYCATLSYAARPAGIEFGEHFTGISMHNYFTLFSLSLCE
jgi:hypothetical protein